MNNKFKCVFKLFSIIFCISLIYYNFPNAQKRVFADDIDTKIDLNKDGNEEIVKFSNGVLNISTSDGKVILKTNENKNVYSKVAFIKDKIIGDTKIIFQNKTKDTSGILSYSIYKMDGSEMKEIIHKDNLYKGVISVRNSTDILEETPQYSKNDSNAVPSYTVKNYYSLEDNKLVFIKTEKLSYSKSSINSIPTEYNKNPSYAEIEKILENVAYEKGIPSEIFKAIAWQESKSADYDNGGVTNWRQFNDGQPLISYDNIGIGIMQVSDIDNKGEAYVNRLKYDIEFNIREGAKILLNKWSWQSSTSMDGRIPKVGDGSPNYLEHWYYAIWAYNGYDPINNPSTNYALAYQTLVIGHVNNVFNKEMIDLYVYKPSLFTDAYPRTDIAEISGKNIGDLKIKDKNYKYIATENLNIRDANMNYAGSYSKNDLVTIKGDPVIKDIYVRYDVEGNGKSGSVVGYGLKPLGDINGDRQVDIFDFVKQSKNINGQGTVVDDTNRIFIGNCDVNMDGVVDIKDIELTAKNYNFSLYIDDIKN